MDTHQQITIRSAGQGRSIAVLGDVYTFLATGEETAGRYALLEATVFPGGGPPPHIHRREEEGFYVLEGEVTFLAGNQRMVAGPGTFLNMPVGSQHAFRNETDRPARMLIHLAPAGLEKMFLEFGRPVADKTVPPQPPTEEEIARLLQLAPQYGVEIVPPPE